MRQEAHGFGVDPMKSFVSLIPGGVRQPVSPIDPRELLFICGSPRGQPKRAGLKHFQTFEVSQNIFTL